MLVPLLYRRVVVEDDSRLQHAVAVAQDGLDGVVVGHADVVGLYADYGAELLVQLMDGQVSSPSPDGVEQP